MKSMNDNSNGSNSNNSSGSSNWLGFSLSPNMKMEVASSDPRNHYHHHHHPRHQTQSSTVAVSDSSAMFLSSQHLSSFTAADDSSGFHPSSNLTVMPIKSDGSLCIMEALTRSQSQGIVPTSSPKLENFLGGANMALSLDSIYYQHNVESEEANRQHSLEMFQQNHPYYSTGGFFQEPSNGVQISQMANWVSRNYSTHQGVEQPVITNTMVDNGSSSNGSMASSMGCGDLQSLTLSMSPGSQSSCVTATAQISPTGADCLAMETKKRGAGKLGQKQPVHRKSIDTFGQRTSQYRGVTKHRWTGRYEAHLWDNSCKKEGQTRKGRQVYLGGYDMEEKAARAYDLAALKYWGPSTHINFPLENYKDELEEMKNMTRQEYVAHLRRKSSGFSRGASMYRGVTRHHQHGRWQARIGRVAGNKDLYLGTFSTQEEAAEAYDIAAVKFRGVNAVTNFDITRYDVEKIISSNTLLAGEQAKRIKAIEPNAQLVEHSPTSQMNMDGNSNSCDWKMVLYDYPHQQQQNGCVETTLEDHNQAPNFPAVLPGLIGIHQASGQHQQSLGGDDSNKMGPVQFSNASSIVTSLSSSREASPDRSGSSSNLLFPRAPVSWITQSQLRPAAAVTMAHLPVFAAWGDA